MSSLEEMYRVFIADLPNATGKTVDQWRAEIHSKGPAKYRERIAWLRTHHQLPYRSACLLAQQAGETADYSNTAGLIDAMYSGPKAGLMPVYLALMEFGRSLSPDVHEAVCKTFVSLKRRYVFLQVKPATRTHIHVGLALPSLPCSARLIPTGGLEKGDRITCRVAISGVEELNDAVRDWIRQAWKLTPSAI